MEQLLNFRRIIVLQILITAAVVATGTLLFGYVEAAKGFVLGSIFSLVNFLLMFHLAPSRLAKSGRSAKAHTALSLVTRMGLLAAPVYIGFHRPDISLIWTAVGIFNLQISILIYGLIIERYGLIGDPSIQGR